jgi:hypothetical protein
MNRGTPGAKSLTNDEADFFLKERIERKRITIEPGENDRPLIVNSAERQRTKDDPPGIIIKRFGDPVDIPAKDDRPVPSDRKDEIADLKDEIAEIEQLLRMGDEET